MYVNKSKHKHHIFSMFNNSCTLNINFIFEYYTVPNIHTAETDTVCCITFLFSFWQIYAMWALNCLHFCVQYIQCSYLSKCTWSFELAWITVKHCGRYLLLWISMENYQTLWLVSTIFLWINHCLVLECWKIYYSVPWIHEVLYYICIVYYSFTIIIIV